MTTATSESPTAVLFGERPKIDVYSTESPNGKSYRLRDIGIDDFFTLLNLVNDIQARGNIGADVYLRGLNLPETQIRSLSSILLMGLGSSKEDVIAFLASLIKVKPDEFRDPKNFPLPATMQLINAFSTHPDVTSFFLESQKSLPAQSILKKMTQKQSSATSTASASATDGQTNASSG